VAKVRFAMDDGVVDDENRLRAIDLARGFVLARYRLDPPALAYSALFLDEKAIAWAERHMPPNARRVARKYQGWWLVSLTRLPHEDALGLPSPLIVLVDVQRGKVELEPIQER